MWDSGWKRRNLGAHWLTHRESYRRRINGVGVGDGDPEDRCGAVDAAGHRQGRWSGHFRRGGAHRGHAGPATATTTAATKSTRAVRAIEVSV